MRVLDAMFPNLTTVLGRNVLWMGWNTFLAWMPVGLALMLFRAPSRRRTMGWWMGVVLFVLFLPNAPYVVTDVIHMRHDLQAVPYVTPVLGVYVPFIASGFLAYYLSLKLLSHYLSVRGLARWNGPVIMSGHALCAVGVFLGRFARLNSWEPVVEPRDTLERTILLLSWPYAPVLLLATFLVTCFGHFATRAIVETAWTAVLMPATTTIHRLATRTPLTSRT